jgi:hypothetical protein
MVHWEIEEQTFSQQKKLSEPFFACLPVDFLNKTSSMPCAAAEANALADSTSSHNTSECGRNAGVPDDLRATETAFVYSCLWFWQLLTPRNEAM